MSLESVSDIVDDLVATWESDRSADSAALEESDDSLPFDHDEVGAEDDGAALAAPPPPEKHPLLVAEGDSWFDYPIKGDLLDVLRKRHGYKIYQVSKAGALLEDMVYGTKKKFWGNDRPQIVHTMNAVAKHKPTAVLFSGGGNDIAGPELIAFINRKAPGVAPLREEAIDDLIFNVFRRAYEVFIGAMRSVAEQGDFELKILGHNYDKPNPDGRGFSFTGIIPGFSYVGPWLRPAFDKKGYSVDEGREIIARILTKFSDLQQSLASNHADYSTVDLHGTLPSESKQLWDNELHPTWGGFKTVGAKVHDAVQAL